MIGCKFRAIYKWEKIERLTHYRALCEERSSVTRCFEELVVGELAFGITTSGRL